MTTDLKMSSALQSTINPLDVSELRNRFQTAKPFPSICIDNFLTEEFAHRVNNSFPSLAESRKMGRSFKAVNEVGKVQVTDAQVFPPALVELHQVLAGAEFLSIMQEMSGYDELLADEELVGGGIHQTGARGRLDVHVDFNYIEERQLYRRLNIIVFFNPGWQDAWGGKLELWDEKVRTCHHTFLPIFNRCVIFETSEISYHGVTAVTCPDHTARRSFAAYYYTRQATPDHAPHSTVFRARPDERIKKYVLMPWNKVRVAVRRTREGARAQAKRLFGGA
jgi:hypothetical protein